MAPWEAISIGRSAVALVGTGRRYLVSMVSRRGTARNVATGPTKELAEKAAASAAPPPIPVQARKVTQADMIAWEREGLAWGQKEGLGHGLRQHGPQHTRETRRRCKLVEQDYQSTDHSPLKYS
jgi:hypothetical protein